MSGRAAKEARRAQRALIEEAVYQAHDALHKDDVDRCHDMLHRALGEDGLEMQAEPITPTAPFDRQFRALCSRLGVKASYVLVDMEHSTQEHARLMSGGDGQLCAVVDKAIRQMSVPEDGAAQ